MKAEGAVADQADLGVEAFEAAVGEAEADGGEDPVAVGAQGAREADEGAQPAAGGPGQPSIEVGGRERGIGQVVEQPEFFAQQEGAVEAAVLALGAIVKSCGSRPDMRIRRRPSRGWCPGARRGPGSRL